MSEYPSTEEPNIPDDLSSVYSSIQYREENRRRAIDLAVEVYYRAKTENERISAAKLVSEMTEIRYDLMSRFPEVFQTGSES